MGVAGLLQLDPGTKVGKYELLSHLAIGGMAELYLARATAIEGFQKRVVLKRILPQYAADDGFVRMFLNEAKLAATLQHPNIAQVFDIGTHGATYFFTMEYVPGPDLRSVMKKLAETGDRVPLDVAISIATGMAAGLHYAHSLRDNAGNPLHLVHRDVSPSNVLLSADGAVKVVDFGIAKAANSGGRTSTGTLKGKVSYMSPEHCQGQRDIDRRADIFALGIVLYEITTGARLFKTEVEFAAMNEIVNGTVPPPSTRVDGEYPIELDAIVMKALEKHPDDRFQTAREMQVALEDLARDQRLRLSSVTIASYLEDLYTFELDDWRVSPLQSNPPESRGATKPTAPTVGLRSPSNNDASGTSALLVTSTDSTQSGVHSSGRGWKFATIAIGCALVALSVAFVMYPPGGSDTDESVPSAIPQTVPAATAQPPPVAEEPSATADEKPATEAAATDATETDAGVEQSPEADAKQAEPIAQKEPAADKSKPKRRTRRVGKKKTTHKKTDAKKKSDKKKRWDPKSPFLPR